MSFSSRSLEYHISTQVFLSDNTVCGWWFRLFLVGWAELTKSGLLEDGASCFLAQGSLMQSVWQARLFTCSTQIPCFAVTLILHGPLRLLDKASSGLRSGCAMRLGSRKLCCLLGSSFGNKSKLGPSKSILSVDAFPGFPDSSLFVLLSEL